MSGETKQIQLLVKCDFPQKEAAIKIDPQSSVWDLKQACQKALEMKDSSKYLFLNVAFGYDVVTFANKTDKDTIEFVRDKSTVFLRAPADIKPARKPKPTKKKDEDKDRKGDEEADRYKGFSAKNALSKLKQAKGSKQKLALEYIDIYAREVFKQPDFRALPLETLLQLVKRNTLNIPEVEVFEGCIEWGRAELKRTSVTDSPETLRKVLAEVMPHIRFPVMTTQDVAVKVNPTKLLEPPQVLELFTYLGMTNSGKSDAKPGKTIVQFSNKKRKGRLPPAWFRWDTNRRHNGLIVSGDGKTVTSTTTSYYQPIFGDAELKEGVWEWEVLMQQMYNNTYSVNIGVTPTSFTNYGVAQMIGYSGHIPGWAFACGHGQKYNQRMENYSRKVNQGETVRVRLDLDAKTLEFFINGQSQGIAYRDVVGPVRPAMSLYGNNIVVLQFPRGA